MDRKRDDRYSDEDAGSEQEFGEPEDTAVLWGSLPHAAQASCSQGHWLGRFRSLGSLYLLLPASEKPRRPLTDVLEKIRETLVEEGQPGDSSSSEGRASCLGPFPVPLPGCSPGGPDVLRSLKPLALSPQENWLCVCEWLTLLRPLTQPFPAAQRDRAGSTCPPWRQRKEKVFYIRYLFNISF